MKIAVTGGAGFIGSRLVEHLKTAGHETLIIDTAHETPIDLMDQAAMSKACAGCDVIYHLAALHSDDVFPRSLYYDVNTQGTKNVIQAAKDNGIKRIIFTSTFALYGLNTGMPTEESEPSPFNDYGESKLQAEHALKEWIEESPENIATIVRPVVVFGEGNRGNVYTLLNQITKKKFVMIGRGNNRKSMAYVGNVAEFLTFCLDEKQPFKVYNYADKPDYQIKNLMGDIYTHLGWKRPSFYLPYSLGLAAGYSFDVLTQVTGKKFPISSVRVQKFCADTTCEAERYRETGFKPKYTLTDGVERMIDHDFSEFKKAS
ncbi:MAG: NAD(P)-dependent oxidoreductase [Alphaproteobacteria bacterium]|nr:NAD(P)-dependent oxidoreductase [Alphaproteobacteria bacterium]